MRIDGLQPREQYKKLRKAAGRPIETKSVAHRDEEEHVRSGWKVVSRSKNRVQVERKRTVADQLELDVWLALYEMGFTTLSGEDGA